MDGDTYIGIILGEWKRKWKLLYIGSYWGYIGMMEKKMETIIYWFILGLYRDNGKENGNYYKFRLVRELGPTLVFACDLPDVLCEQHKDVNRFGQTMSARPAMLLTGA